MGGGRKSRRKRRGLKEARRDEGDEQARNQDLTGEGGANSRAASENLFGGGFK